MVEISGSTTTSIEAEAPSVQSEIDQSPDQQQQFPMNLNRAQNSNQFLPASHSNSPAQSCGINMVPMVPMNHQQFSHNHPPPQGYHFVPRQNQHQPHNWIQNTRPQFIHPRYAYVPHEICGDVDGCNNGQISPMGNVYVVPGQRWAPPFPVNNDWESNSDINVDFGPWSQSANTMAFNMGYAQVPPLPQQVIQYPSFVTRGPQPINPWVNEMRFNQPTDASYNSPVNSYISNVDPTNMRYTKLSIYAAFTDGGLLEDAVEALKNGSLQTSAFPQIRVVQHRGIWYSLDNRRLWIYKAAKITAVSAIVMPLFRKLRMRLETQSYKDTVDIRWPNSMAPVTFLDSSETAPNTPQSNEDRLNKLNDNFTANDQNNVETNHEADQASHYRVVQHKASADESKGPPSITSHTLQLQSCSKPKADLSEELIIEKFENINISKSDQPNNYARKLQNKANLKSTTDMSNMAPICSVNNFHARKENLVKAKSVPSVPGEKNPSKKIIPDSSSPTACDEHLRTY
mmetsp:Transcript_9080/g.13579  ORF Transcript_9080/g.13579 Transcript_9080/m.13579 type:complete len:514 (+) Transcript_9080:162-1703(+)